MQVLSSLTFRPELVQGYLSAYVYSGGADRGWVGILSQPHLWCSLVYSQPSSLGLCQMLCQSSAWHRLRSGMQVLTLSVSRHSLCQECDPEVILVPGLLGRCQTVVVMSDMVISVVKILPEDFLLWPAKCLGSRFRVNQVSGWWINLS